MHNISLFLFKRCNEISRYLHSQLETHSCLIICGVTFKRHEAALVGTDRLLPLYIVSQ